MELAYDGQITKKNFGFSRLKLMGKLLFHKGRHAVNLYWNKSEHGPMAEIDPSKISYYCKRTLSDLCLKEGFMVKNIS